MIYVKKPLPFDPQKIKGMSERILLSHYENNYGGAVARLNSISDQLVRLNINVKNTSDDRKDIFTPEYGLNTPAGSEMTATRLFSTSILRSSV